MLDHSLTQRTNALQSCTLHNSLWHKQLLLTFIPLHEKFLQFNGVRAVVFQLNLKYLHVKITNLLWVVV